MPIELPPISRRKFLSRTLAAAALALAPGCAAPLAPKPPENDPAGLSVALLSDIHISANPQFVERGVNMTRNLMTVRQEMLAWPQKPALAFVNGDLALNTGSRVEYEAVLDLLRPIREAGVPIYLGLGNHDNRQNFWDILKDEKTVPDALPHRQASIVRTESANFFVLDSLIKTLWTPGSLGPDQRLWLADALDANADKPAIILIHHHPAIRVAGITAGGLEDAPELMHILRPRRQVKAWFFGHTHHWETKKDSSGIHLINLPPTSYVFETGRPSGWVHASVRNDGATIQLRCVDQSHPEHGQVVDLPWRTA